MSEVSKNADHSWQKLNKNGEEKACWSQIATRNPIDNMDNRYSIVMEQKLISTRSL